MMVKPRTMPQREISVVPSRPLLDGLSDLSLLVSLERAKSAAEKVPIVLSVKADAQEDGKEPKVADNNPEDENVEDKKRRITHIERYKMVF